MTDKWIVITDEEGKRLSINTANIKYVIGSEEGQAVIVMEEGSKLKPTESFDQIFTMLNFHNGLW